MAGTPQWTVTMRIERDIAVTVEAEDAGEARQKALAWEIVGDEQELDTVGLKVTGVSRDD